MAQEINCPECNEEMTLHDTLYSNINTHRCKKGEHTGDVYKCDECGVLLCDNFLSGKIENFKY